MSEIENGRLGLHGTEHAKCNHLITLGFKGLRLCSAQHTIGHIGDDLPIQSIDWCKKLSSKLI